MWQKTRFGTRLRTPGLSHINSPLSHPHRTHVFCTLSTVTAGSSSGLGLNHDIYVSTSTDPYFNLTFEDWLFRHSPPNKPLLLIYRDSPCVIIGRNQNPWTEVNFHALQDARIPFLRRRSGGGTVYHDLGNTNFSIHLPRISFDRHATGQLVLAGVRALGIDANLNSRNDICVGTDNSDHYISGSAYKIVNNRAYHHGTMLISTELSTLGSVLRPQKEGIVTKGVGSVRSPVCNLRQFDQNVTHESFTSAVVEQFRREFGVSTQPVIVHDTEEIKDVDYIKKGMSELSTWDWMYGQTPEFTQTLQQTFSGGKVVVELHSRHGIILDTRLDAKDAHVPDTALYHTLTSLLEGKRYGFLDQIPSEHALSQPAQELYAWLRQATNVSRS